MKHLFTNSRTDQTIVITDEVLCKGNKEDGFTYFRNVKSIDVFIETFKDGYLSGELIRHKFDADAIIRLAEQIKEIRNMPASKDEVEDYGF